MAGIPNERTRKRQNRLALFDLLPLFDERAETVTIHIHGIDAHVNEHFHAIVRRNADRVLRRSYCGNRAGKGSNNAFLIGFDSTAATHYSRAEHRIRNIRQLDHCTGNRRKNDIGRALIICHIAYTYLS